MLLLESLLISLAIFIIKIIKHEHTIASASTKATHLNSGGSRAHRASEARL
jgi:hypothetical protein